MDRSYWKEQVQKYRTRSLSDAEEVRLWEALADPASADEWKGIIQELFREQAQRADYHADDWEPVLQAVFNSDREALPSKVRRLPVIRRFAVAAAIAGGILLGGYWLLSKYRTTERPTIVKTVLPNDVPAPATNRARITLASGQQLYLDSAGNGALASQAGAQVVKLASGQVAYQTGGGLPHPAALLYNSLTNPRGSQVVTLTLSDGTRVWLNAESSIRYPVIFGGADRTVEITGEGYFEVTKKSDQPFIVAINNQAKIEVLGTSFNVNAYTDENGIKTTLLEGSVRVEAENKKVVLRPGQQAQVGSADQINKLTGVDTAAVMAWKNGRFAFNNANLQTVMRELSRWYDVDVTYQGTMPNRSFNGEIGKTLTLDQLLKVLSTTTRLHYTIKEKKLIIQP